MTAVESLRLRLTGVQVPVTGGEALLRFDLLGLSILEEDFGSIDAAYQAFHAVRRDEKREEQSSNVIGSFLRAGMATLDRIPSAREALAIVECHPDIALDLIAEALVQAFPPPDADTGKAEADESSTGRPSITPPPSAGDDPTPSSGP